MKIVISNTPEILPAILKKAIGEPRRQLVCSIAGKNCWAISKRYWSNHI